MMEEKRTQDRTSGQKQRKNTEQHDLSPQALLNKQVCPRFDGPDQPQARQITSAAIIKKEGGRELDGKKKAQGENV